MRPQKFVLFMMGMFASLAFAKSNTEYFFQPAAGASALDLTYVMGDATVDLISGGNYKLEQRDFDLNYAYGINANNAVGVYDFHGTLKTKSSGVTTSAEGMGDVHVYYKGFTDIWHYGADLGVNTSKSKNDNRSTGGMSLALQGGALWTSGAWNFGPNLIYDIMMERTDDTTPETKTTGGNTLTVAGFAEYNLGAGFVGGELAMISIDKTTDKQSGVSSSNKAYSATSLKVYGSYAFNDMVDGLLSVSQRMAAKNSDLGNKAYTFTTIDLGVRLNF